MYVSIQKADTLYNEKIISGCDHIFWSPDLKIKALLLAAETYSQHECNIASIGHFYQNSIGIISVSKNGTGASLVHMYTGLLTAIATYNSYPKMNSLGT